MRQPKMQFAALLFVFTGWIAYAQNPPITVEIKPAQTEVKAGDEFVVSTVLRNTGTETRTMRHDSCGYGDLWISDNESIQMSAGACKKPGFTGVTLKAGEVYRADVHIYAKLAAGFGEGGWVTFRLGFKSEFRSENDPAQPRPPTRTLWSNPVTVKVTR